MAASRTFAAGRPHDSQSSRLVTGLLHGTLFLVILVSPFVFIEPAPYEFLMGLLLLACLASRVAVPELVAIPAALLMLWSLGGIFSLLNVLDKPKSIIFIGTSFYLAITAVLFACIFFEDCVRRLAIMKTAYILAALFAAAFGIGAYFSIFPGAEEFTLYGRARSTFKDPNVYAPFLVLPLLLLIEQALRERIRVWNLAAGGLLVAALLLAFSRGGWANAAISLVVMMALMFVSAGSVRLRIRILLLGSAAIGVAAALVAALISIDAVGDLFRERAALVQPYDTGESGRFGNQLRSLPILLDHPNGFGALEFGVIFPEAPHNVYVNAFAGYGWLGGIAYFVLVLVTLLAGLKYVLVGTPWRPYFIPIYAAYIGVVVEGAVVDTDHWRHFFLLLGAVWGLAAATHRYVSASTTAGTGQAQRMALPANYFRVSKIG